jgi:DNA-binding MarR family transcriptional regulator
MSVLKGKYKLQCDKEEHEFLLLSRKKPKLNDHYSQCTDEALVHLSKLDLTRYEYRVILFLISQMNFGNYCYKTQSYISKELNIAQPNVSKTLKSLIDKGLIFKETTDEGKAIRVSAVLAWKGTGDNEYIKRFHSDSEKINYLIT